MQSVPKEQSGRPVDCTESPFTWALLSGRQEQAASSVVVRAFHSITHNLSLSLFSLFLSAFSVSSLQYTEYRVTCFRTRLLSFSILLFFIPFISTFDSTQRHTNFQSPTLRRPVSILSNNSIVSSSAPIDRDFRLIPTVHIILYIIHYIFDSQTYSF